MNKHGIDPISVAIPYVEALAVHDVPVLNANAPNMTSPASVGECVAGSDGARGDSDTRGVARRRRVLRLRDVDVLEAPTARATRCRRRRSLQRRTVRTVPRGHRRAPLHPRARVCGRRPGEPPVAPPARQSGSRACPRGSCTGASTPRSSPAPGSSGCGTQGPHAQPAHAGACDTCPPCRCFRSTTTRATRGKWSCCR